LALYATARGLAQPESLRHARRWAAAQEATPAGRWRLALALVAGRARNRAANAMLGLPGPAPLRPQITIEGEENLRAACERGGVLLAGFHLGPARRVLPLLMAGYRVATIAGHADALLASRAGWRACLDMSETLLIPKGDHVVAGLQLARATRLLLERRIVYLDVDGGRGPEAFRISVPGGSIIVRARWLALRHHARPTTLPILAHLEGHRRVITVYPPLPDPDPDRARDREVCRAIISAIVDSYVRRFPEQCRWWRR